MLFLAGYYLHQDEITGAIAILLGALLALAVFYITTWPQLRMDWRERRLLRDGLAADGEIVHSEFTGTLINNQPQYRVQVRYVHPLKGKEYTATALALVDYISAGGLSPGERVPLHVGTDRPDHIAIG